MNLLPPNILDCHPDSSYEFKSQDELRKNIVYANQNENLYIHFIEMSRNFTLRTILLILATHTVLLTLYTITSCFQGKFARGQHIYNIGDNGSGNNYLSLSFIPGLDISFYVIGAPGANICKYLGTGRIPR